MPFRRVGERWRRVGQPLGLAQGGAPTYSISGKVLAADGVTAVPGATVALGAYSGVSGADGTYTISDLAAGTSGLLTATKTNYAWDSITISAMVASLTDQDFVGIARVLQDLFTTTASAPLTSPRTCEPGPGTFIITDTGNKYTIASAILTSSGRTGNGDPGILSDAITAKAGRIYTYRIKGNSFSVGIADSSETVINTGLSFYGSNLYLHDNKDQSGIIAAISATEFYDVTLVQRFSGSMVFIKGGSFTDWTLLAVLTRAEVAAFKVLFTNFVTSVAHYLDDVSVFDVGGIWSKRYPYATDYEAFPATAATIATVADCVFCIKHVPAADTVLDVLVRYLDDNNHWIVRFDIPNTKIDIIKKESGSESGALATVGSVAYLTGGAGHTFFVWCVGSTIYADYKNKAVSYASATFQQTQTGSKINFNTGTLKEYAAFPYNTITPPIFSDYSETAPLNLFLYGDSKTTNFDIRYFQEELEAARSAGAYEYTARVGRSGAVLADFQSTVDADLAAKTGTPDFAIVNIGVNDIASLPDEATWKSNYGYVLDAIHTKWAACTILVAYPWEQGQDTNANTMAGWIDTVLSTRAWAAVGLDERVTIKGDDDGATNTSDGLHYSDAGQAAAAAAWAASM